MRARFDNIMGVLIGITYIAGLFLSGVIDVAIAWTQRVCTECRHKLPQHERWCSIGRRIALALIVVLLSSCGVYDGLRIANNPNNYDGQWDHDPCGKVNR